MINSRFAAISQAALLAVFARCSHLTGGAGGETTNGRITGADFRKANQAHSASGSNRPQSAYNSQKGGDRLVVFGNE